MLYHIFYPLVKYHSVFNVFQYITFRTIYAAVTAMLLSLIIGPYLIKKLKLMQLEETIRTDGPETHKLKAGTPTMGGALIICAALGGVLLWGNLLNRYVWVAVFVMLGMAVIGYVDDYRKVVLKDKKGLRPKPKYFWQFMVALAAGLYLYLTGFDTSIAIPFFKNVKIELGVLYVPFVVLVITGASNAVNLTDGLDGLAIGPTLISAATYLLLAYLAGHVKIANYLQVPYVAGVGELAIFGGALVGASLGFLWYNTYPAQVFMGDIGALSLGGALGAMAILTKHEVLLVIVGGIFVLEAVSVIVQVASFRLTGKRVFAMAPIHHHFELKGWAEPKIIVRFWIISVILALIAISTLKLR